MSFWDNVDEKDTHPDLSALISDPNPDYEAILQNPDLFRTFKTKDDNLLSFMLTKTTFEKILSIMMENINSKISKACVELFIAKDSPMLKELIEKPLYTEFLITLAEKSAGTNDLVKLGYVSRIYQKAVEEDSTQKELVNLFNSNIYIILFLTKNVHDSSVYDLLLAYLTSQPPEDQWLIFSYLQMILPRGKSANCPKCFFKYKDNIVNLIKSMNGKLLIQDKINIIRLMKFSLEKSQNPDVAASIATNLPLIYEAESESSLSHFSTEIRFLILDTAYQLPSQRFLLNVSAKLIQKAQPQIPYTKLEIAALRLLSRTPSKTLALLLPNIIDCFVNETSNTFHHIAFFEFIKQAMTVPELKNDIINKLPSVIIENASLLKWRQNANRISYYLQIADLIDSSNPELQQSNSNWADFVNTSLKKWRERTEGLDQAPEPVAIANKEMKDIDFPTKSDFSSENSPDAFGTQNQKIDFPDFPNTQEQKPQEEIVFPEMNEIQQDEVHFPDFGQNQEVKKDEVHFPDFPDPNQTDNGFQFPSEMNFPSIDDNKEEKVEFGFPTEEKPKHIEKDKTSNTNNDADSFSPDDESFEHFMALVHNPCWEYTGPSPEELFGQKEKFSSPEEAFKFLVNQNY